MTFAQAWIAASKLGMRLEILQGYSWPVYGVGFIGGDDVVVYELSLEDALRSAERLAVASWRIAHRDLEIATWENIPTN